MHLGQKGKIQISHLGTNLCHIQQKLNKIRKYDGRRKQLRVCSGKLWKNLEFWEIN